MPASLVTGGAGFIGSHLVRLLAARGETVRILDTIEPADAPPGVEFHNGSVLDPDAVSKAMDGVDRLYHLAGLPQLWLADKGLYDRVNHQGTTVVLAAAMERRLSRVVHCSTEAVMVGREHSAATRDESSSPTLAEMAGPYCRSKLLAERAALEAAGRGLPLVVVNPTAVIGPGDRMETPPSRMLRLFIPGGPRLILDCTLNLVDVRDVADGIILAAERGRTGERYTLGGTNIRLSDLAARIDRLAWRRPRRRFGIPGRLALAVAHVDEWWSDHVSGRPPTAPVTGVRLAIAGGAFSSEKAEVELGYAPRPLDDSLADAVAWLARQAAAGSGSAVEILPKHQQERLRSAR